ncbi:MAG: tetratricopeptide repeat protein [Candidatus Melainabacteria bacterium]|nr:tetratricopeptide repeat protein [Candidatus Melainabacteria bacterium]
MEPSEKDWHPLTSASTKPSAEHLIPGLYALARCWFDRGDYAPAEKIYRLIINIDDQVKNITCTEVVLSALDMARLLMETHRLMEAEHMYLRAINRCTRCLGQQHSVYARILQSYAELLRTMNLEKEAAELEDRAREVKSMQRMETRDEAAFSDSAVSSATIG